MCISFCICKNVIKTIKNSRSRSQLVFTCWLSSMISASPPPFRVIGMFRLIPVEGAEFMTRGGAGIVFGAVGDVRWGPMCERKVISQSQHTTSHSSQSQSRSWFVSQWKFKIHFKSLRLDEHTLKIQSPETAQEKL